MPEVHVSRYPTTEERSDGRGYQATTTNACRRYAYNAMADAADWLPLSSCFCHTSSLVLVCLDMWLVWFAAVCCFMVWELWWLTLCWWAGWRLGFVLRCWLWCWWLDSWLPLLGGAGFVVELLVV